MEDILRVIAPVIGILFYAFLFEWWRSCHPAPNPNAVENRRKNVYLTFHNGGFLCRRFIRKRLGKLSNMN